MKITDNKYWVRPRESSFIIPNFSAVAKIVSTSVKYTMIMAVLLGYFEAAKVIKMPIGIWKKPGIQKYLYKTCSKSNFAQPSKPLYIDYYWHSPAMK